jgi:hypothetical protein
MSHDLDLFQNLIFPIRNKLEDSDYEFLINATEKFIKMIKPKTCWCGIPKDLNTNNCKYHNEK